MKRVLLISTGVVVVLALLAQLVFQVFIAAAPRPAFYFLNVTNAIQLGAIVWLAGVILYTNVRRPSGVDPDRPHPAVSPDDRATLDAFSLSTDDLVDHERRRIPLGRRATDPSIADIQRTIMAIAQIRDDDPPRELLDQLDQAERDDTA